MVPPELSRWVDIVPQQNSCRCILCFFEPMTAKLKRRELLWHSVFLAPVKTRTPAFHPIWLVFRSDIVVDRNRAEKGVHRNRESYLRRRLSHLAKSFTMPTSSNLISLKIAQRKAWSGWRKWEALNSKHTTVPSIIRNIKCKLRTELCASLVFRLLED